MMIFNMAAEELFFIILPYLLFFGAAALLWFIIRSAVKSGIRSAEKSSQSPI